MSKFVSILAMWWKVAAWNAFDGAVIGTGGVGLVNFMRYMIAPKSQPFRLSNILTPTAASLGGLLAILMSIINTTFHAKKSLVRQNAFLAGLIAYRLIPGSVRRLVTVFAVSRAISVSFPNVFLKHPFFVSLFANFTVLGAFLNRPDLISVSYLGFLEKFTKQHGSDFAAFRANMQTGPTACACMHPGTTSCLAACPLMFADIFRNQALLFYTRLYSPFLLLGIASSKSSATKSGLLIATVHRILRSAATLSTYTSLVLSACCIGCKLPGHKPFVIPLLSTVAGSLAFQLEPTTRQYQLSQFMLGQSLDVLVRFYASAGLPAPEGTAHVLFASALCALVADVHETPTSAANGIFLKYILDTPNSGHSLRPSKLLTGS